MLHSPKSRNCFMDRGEGENLEKWSTCLGTLASAAVFIRERTNFILLLIFTGSVKEVRQRERLDPQEGRKSRGSAAGDAPFTVCRAAHEALT